MEYGINPVILQAIAKVESNYNPSAVNKNSNGSYDFGVMQINSIWASTLGRERWNNLGDACTNIKTGAMILAGCMKKYGYSWQAIGCYNSQTPGKSERYARRVFKQLKHIQEGGAQYAVAHEGAHVEAAVATAAQASLAPTTPQAPGAVQAGDGPVGLDASSVFQVEASN